MNGAVSDSATTKAGTTSLAIACTVVWVLAAASTGPLGIWLAIGGTAIALGVAILVFDRPAARRLLEPSPRLVLLGAAAGGLMVAVTYLLYPVLARLAPFIATDTVRLYSAFRPPSLVIASVALTPVILGEELVWRGVVQTVLVRRFRAWGGVTLAAVAYALAHAPLGSPVLVIVALLCGLFWGALRATTSSLVPTLVAHLVWDLLVLLWLPLDSR